MASTLSLGLDFLAKQEIKKIMSDLETDNDLYNPVTYPLIYTQADMINVKQSSPFVMVQPINNFASKVTYGQYQDLDKDDRIQKTITKYYLYKILDKWLYKELKSLLAFIKIEDGKPKLIRSMSEYDEKSLDNDSLENIEAKIDYMEKILIDRKLVKHVLKKIVSENEIHWYHLNNNEDKIKKIFNSYLKSKLEEAIKGNK